MKDFRRLAVWHTAHRLTLDVYAATRPFPSEERFGITSQARRASTSIPANIAEGHGREHLGDYLHHLSIANGSLMELETHIHISRRLSYLSPADEDDFLVQAREVGRMLAGLIRSLKARATGT